MFCAGVEESMRKDAGGGLAEHEAIEVLSLPLEIARAFLEDDTICKSAGLCFGLQWLCLKQGIRI